MFYCTICALLLNYSLVASCFNDDSTLSSLPCLKRGQFNLLVASVTSDDARPSYY